MGTELVQARGIRLESLDYLPDLRNYRMTQEVYLEHLRQAKAAVDIPILGSLNGASTRPCGGRADA